MSRAKGRASSGLSPNCRFAPTARVWKVCTSVLDSLDKNRAKSCAAFGFRPKLQSRAESFNLESLVIRSEKSGKKLRQGSRRFRI